MESVVTEKPKAKWKDTGVECVVCGSGTMLVRSSIHKGGDVTEHLECSNCQESYPRLVSALNGKVLVDPMKNK